MPLSTNQDLTVILPIRVTENRIDTIAQISNIFLDDKLPKDILFLVVDDGSEERYSKEILFRCQELGIGYLYSDTSSQPFSLSRARNRGAQKAQSQFIMFQDIDMLPYSGFYNDIVEEIQVQGIEQRINAFMMIGVIYLTKYGTQYYSASSKQHLLDRLMVNNSEYIERYSTATSIILLHKEHFDAIGGYDENFEKWGHEDIDLNCRLILEDNLCILPDDFIKDEKNFNNIFEYRGWKSIYRLYGDRTFFKGIVLFHAWHPTHQDSDYYSNKIKNKKYFHDKLEKYIERYKDKLMYQIDKKSILFDRYQYSISPSNRLKCQSIVYTLYHKIRKIF